jgi:peptidoglycan/xylan/chitin deacetylase (PgdA/CDA1 family)
MKKYFLALILMIVAFNINAKNKIEDYQRIFRPLYLANGELMIAIRVFKMNDIPSFLLVNPDSLETKVMPVNQLFSGKIQQTKEPESTRYYQLLNKSTEAPYPLENKGITHAENIKKGAVLTIDLCPTRKPFEVKFFKTLEQLSDEAKKPIPITLAISGKWLLKHPDEFNWLLKKQEEHKFAITWANHSFNHVFYHDLPYSENFLLLKGTNFDLEIVLTEKYLLEVGQLPSIFFRFPGLVSNKKLIKDLKKYGLIPLGADAWLAKDQAITPGGIILVHGNSKEHEGIIRLLPQLKTLELIDIKKGL